MTHSFPTRRSADLEALRNNVDISRLLVSLVEARFDPARFDQAGADGDAREAEVARIEERLAVALDDVASLDHDRILRSYLTIIRATLRTNYFQQDGTKPYISFKLAPTAIPELPEPRPRYAIFVCSPQIVRAPV